MPTAERTAKLGKKYQQAKKPLFDMQHSKCCYCEAEITEPAYNDVEHFRPKSMYWWLTWSWTNLLFACPSCNRSNKKDEFPLARGSTKLLPEQVPPGLEAPLLIDPCGATNPLDHIKFIPYWYEGHERWTAIARGGTSEGRETIRVLGLRRTSLVDAYSRFVKSKLEPEITDLMRDGADITNEWRKLCRRLIPKAPFVALTIDVIRFKIPKEIRAANHLCPRNEWEESFKNMCVL